MRLLEVYDDDIKSQFREDIQLVVNECGSDMAELTDQLLSLHDFALGNGLRESEWTELVNEIDPEICNFITFAKMAA